MAGDREGDLKIRIKQEADKLIFKRMEDLKCSNGANFIFYQLASLITSDSYTSTPYRIVRME